MVFLNLGCGADRPKDEKWINIDNLYELFPDKAMPERQQLENEPNYREWDLRKGLPFNKDSVDGILMSHFLEHLDIQESIGILRESLRVLRPNGIVRISVPDPTRFYELSLREKYEQVEWGDINYQPNISFMEYALFFTGHKQLLTKDCLFCLFFIVGFSSWKKMDYKQTKMEGLDLLDNRPVFSLFVEATK